MSVVRRLATAARSLPLVAGVGGVLAGGALLVLRVLPSWVGLAVLGGGVVALSLAHWWEGRGALAGWVPLLLGAAVLLAGVTVWQTLRLEGDAAVEHRLDLAARGVRSEVEHRLDLMSVAMSDLASQDAGAALRSLQDWHRAVERVFETYPALEAVEWLGPDGEIRVLETRAGEPQRVARPGSGGLELLRDAAARSGASGGPVAVGPFPAEGADTRFRILVPMTAADGRRVHLSGLFSAHRTFSDLAESVAPGHDFRVLAAERELFGSLDLADGAAIRTLPLEVPGGIDWTLEVALGRALVVDEPFGFAELVLAVSVVMALLLALTSWAGERAQRRARSFEAAVTERTAELEAAKADAQAANAAKDRFLAMLGHELRNPLASVSTALEVLERRSAEGTAGQEDRMRGILQRQMRHMARLVDDLLDISRIERGKLPLHLERLDLARLVRDAGEAERARIEAAGLAFDVEVAPGPLWVEGDPTRLTQVIYNLLSNAAKFTEPGGRIQVQAFAESLSGRAAVRVRDSGIGIDPEDLERVFEPFAQTDGAVERAAGGLGLGLPIVKSLVEAHGGEIEAASGGRGLGAELTLRLPLAGAPARAAAGQAREEPGAGRRILVIDDHPDSAEGLSELLQLYGHRVEVARDGAEGLAAAARSRPEVVICDIALPGELDGYGVAKALRREPETARLQLVALTGFGDEESIRRALEAGFDRHLTKPVDPALLRAVVAPREGRGGRLREPEAEI